MLNPNNGCRMEKHVDGDAHVIRLIGEINLRNSPDIREALLGLLAERPQQLIIDLERVHYMDSSGVGTLVELKRRSEQGGARFALAALQPRVRNLFQMTKLDLFFRIFSSVQEARQ
jgi:anti-anti-sigma factor